MPRNSRTKAIGKRKCRSLVVPPDMADQAPARPSGKPMSRRAMAYLSAAVDVEALPVSAPGWGW